MTAFEQFSLFESSHFTSWSKAFIQVDALAREGILDEGIIGNHDGFPRFPYITDQLGAWGECTGTWNIHRTPNSRTKNLYALNYV